MKMLIKTSLDWHKLQDQALHLPVEPGRRPAWSGGAVQRERIWLPQHPGRQHQA